MTLETLALIPLLPLLAAAITSGMRCGRRSAGIAVAAMLGSCVLALLLTAALIGAVAASQGAKVKEEEESHDA